MRLGVGTKKIGREDDGEEEKRSFKSSFFLLLSSSPAAAVFFLSLSWHLSIRGEGRCGMMVIGGNNQPVSLSLVRRAC